VRRFYLKEDAPETHVVATMLNNLGAALLKKGDFADAAADFAQTLAVRKKIFGAVHPEVANALTRLALARARRGQFDEAEAMVRDALAMETKLSLGDHPYVADSEAVLGLVLGKKTTSQARKKS
jgi:tetratricopeptide (TPR) repeat protein